MQLRKPNGQFLPAPVKVGSKVLNNFNGFNPGFTFGKVYTVLKTFRCKDRSFSYGKGDVSELRNQWEFLVIDDDGLIRRGDLRSVVGNANTPEHSRFSKWEVVGSSKKPFEEGVEEMKSVEHWKQVKASELRPFDVVMIPWFTLVPTTCPKTGRPKKKTVTRYKRVMITSNYLSDKSPYAKLHYSNGETKVPTYRPLDKSHMVWKFVESRVSKVWLNELDKITSPDYRWPLFNSLFGAHSIAGIRASVESSSVRKLREFLETKPTLRDHVHNGRTV